MVSPGYEAPLNYSNCQPANHRTVENSPETTLVECLTRAFTADVPPLPHERRHAPRYRPQLCAQFLRDCEFVHPNDEVAIGRRSGYQPEASIEAKTGERAHLWVVFQHRIEFAQYVVEISQCTELKFTHADAACCDEANMTPHTTSRKELRCSAWTTQGRGFMPSISERKRVPLTRYRGADYCDGRSRVQSFQFHSHAVATVRSELVLPESMKNSVVSRRRRPCCTRSAF